MDHSKSNEEGTAPNGKTTAANGKNSNTPKIKKDPKKPVYQAKGRKDKLPPIDKKSMSKSANVLPHARKKFATMEYAKNGKNESGGDGDTTSLESPRETKTPTIFSDDFSLSGGGETETTMALTDPKAPPAPKLLKQVKNARTALAKKKDTRRHSLHVPNPLVQSQSQPQTNARPAVPERGSSSSKEKEKEKEPVTRVNRVNSASLVNPKRPLLPMTPSACLRQFKEQLSPFEQKEVHQFQEIFFWGPTPNKLRPLTATHNNGYDDDKGDYKIVINDHISYRYEILSILGKGTFGQVVKVNDHKTHKQYAIKIIRNRSRYHQQALVEMKILDYMKLKDPQNQSNVIQTVATFYFRQHFCIIFELLSINLYEFIKANHFRGFSLNLIRKISIQVLNALKFMAKHHIIHCDMKPENILLNEPTKSNVTVIDFGSSCFEHEKIYTYIQSRFYRAPEIILGISYTCAIDMWSFACILVELYTGTPIFPGESELDQLACIMELLGVPSPSILDISTRKKYFFTATGKPRIIENSQGIRRIPGTKTLVELLNGCDDQLFLNFISECLKYNPKERMTPFQALQHPWILQGEKVDDPNTQVPDYQESYYQYESNNYQFQDYSDFPPPPPPPVEDEVEVTRPLPKLPPSHDKSNFYDQTHHFHDEAKPGSSLDMRLYEDSSSSSSDDDDEDAIDQRYVRPGAKSEPPPRYLEESPVINETPSPKFFEKNEVYSKLNFA